MKIRMASAFALTAFICFSAPAKASDWGCKVLLCLADPRGPTTEAECRPPIYALWEALRKGRPFPTCDLAGGPGGDSYARQGSGFFDQCPEGTTALEAGVAAVQQAPSAYLDRSNPVYIGIGEGDNLWPSMDQPQLPPKVCVAGELGTATMPGATPEDGPYQVKVFQQVVSVPAQGSGAYIDVFVNGQLFNRVRY